ncbi:MAG: DNA repair protein RecN, partial [Bacteroides sp.]|nr:DNA repair protein RecN [Bacteroides sp.]
VEAADRLTDLRRAAAETLAATIMEQARPLAMPNIVCRIDVTPGKLNASGRDTVEWLFAFNKNQEPQPVGDTASGGEISRIMLVLKCILAGRIGLPTIIFDEIDTGVSGDVAARIGRLMAAGADAMQIVTITHLPQVAARGSRHFKVYKVDDDTSTGTYISLLGHDERRSELAAMIAGDPADPAALATADSLLSHTN